MVVDYVLDYVQMGGRLEGRGRKRVLTFGGGVLNMRTGRITPHVRHIQKNVEKILAGTATYRRRGLV